MLYQNLFRACTLLAACSIGGNAMPQTMLSLLEESDFIVVGDTVAQSPAGTGVSRRADGTERAATIKVVKIAVDVVYSTKGSTPERIEIFVPLSTVQPQGFVDRNMKRFDVIPGQRNVWFLRKRTADGFPTRMDDRLGEKYNFTWQPDDGDIAPTTLFGETCQIRASKLYTGSGHSVYSRLCDIGAFGLKDNDMQVRISGDRLLWELNPKKSNYSEDAVARAQAYMKDAERFRDKRITEILLPTIPEEKLRALEIQLDWGRAELSKEYADLLLTLDSTAVVFTPSELAMSDQLRLLSHRDPKVVMSCLGQMRDWKFAKEDITSRILKRFGESRDLDIAILEVLSNLWDRKDLSPRDEKGQYKTDLSLEIYMAKKLVGGD